MRRLPLHVTPVATLAMVAVLGCAPPGDETLPAGVETAAEGTAPSNAIVSNAIVDLLASGRAAFGVFSGEQTAEQGARTAAVAEADLVFYSMEEGPFDVARMQAYMDALRGAAVDPESARPLVLRVPPASAGEDALRQHVTRALDAGVHGIVFPHVRHAADAELALGAMRFAEAAGSPPGARPQTVGRAPQVWGASEDAYRRAADLWPLTEDGELVAMLIVEDEEGVANAAEIAATPGIGVLFAGPGDLRRAYDGDLEAVEAAIQTVLAACQEHGVACGITAGPDDVEARLAEGFRVIIVLRDEALAIGRAAAGRAG
ncbi:MAG TPA: aldolase/citrate lyase family protein [Thermoanaerobaculia bacterium]|nr:aldolase/citrate lyase family protein [Thermoanaerobaculia bacterium]